jgi:hypothetical protein
MQSWPGFFANLLFSSSDCKNLRVRNWKQFQNRAPCLEDENVFLAFDDVGESGDIPPAEPGRFGFFQTGTASLPFDFSTNLAKTHEGVKLLLRGTDPAIENLNSSGAPLVLGRATIISPH